LAHEAIGLILTDFCSDAPNDVPQGCSGRLYVAVPHRSVRIYAGRQMSPNMRAVMVTATDSRMDL